MKRGLKNLAKAIKRVMEANINLEHYWFLPRVEEKPVRVKTALKMKQEINNEE
jgi:hypothetical protein